MSIDLNALREKVSGRILSELGLENTMSHLLIDAVATEAIFNVVDTPFTVSGDALTALKQGRPNAFPYPESALLLKEALPKMVLESLAELGVSAHEIRFKGALGLDYKRITGNSQNWASSVKKDIGSNTLSV